MVTDLGGAQITSLLEALPGIAQVLRSPVADAFVSLIRQAARHQDFQLSDAEEVLRYSVRRNLMSQDESERILAELREGIQRRADRAADRAEARKPPAAARVVPKVKPKATAKAKPVAAKPKAAKPVKAAKPAKTARPAKAAVRSAPKPAAKKKVPARKR